MKYCFVQSHFCITHWT